MKQMLGLLLLIGIIGAYFWQIVAVAAVVLVIWLIIRHINASQAEAARLAAANAAVARRADEQHQWTISGDDRGVFGEGTTAMDGYRRVTDPNYRLD